MPAKRATFFTSSKDERCVETQKFIEDAGIILDVRDLTKQPLTEDELSKLIGNLELLHFLNPGAPSYGKYDIDTHLSDRPAIIKLMAADNSIIRKPIIKAARLITVGHDRRKISEMLLIKGNGQHDDEPAHNHGRHNNPREAASVK